MKYIAEADIFNQVWVEAASLVDLLQQAVDYVVEICVFEAALVTLGKRCADGQGNDNIVGVLLCAGSCQWVWVCNE